MTRRGRSAVSALRPGLTGPSPGLALCRKGCFSVASGPRYGVREYGGVAGEHAMQAEILARGPIVCGART